MRRLFLISAAALCVPASPAAAQEAFAGAYVHAVATPLTFDSGEGGADLALGYRFAPIEALSPIGKPAPYLIASLNSRGDTSFAGAGLSWKLGKGPVYVRPGIGLVVHTGPSLRVDAASGLRTDMGSRVLFEPEIAVGIRIAPRLGIEASWVHISHAQLFNAGQNPGIDMVGLRLTLATR